MSALEVADLLDENGTVNEGAVKSLTNAAAGGTAHITHERCDAFRKYLREGHSAREAATHFETGSTSIRTHARGECHHTETRLSEPTLSFSYAEGWTADE